MDLLVKIVIFWFCFKCVKPQEKTTTESELATMVEVTDAPKYTVDDVVFVDYGRYKDSSLDFHYNNYQNFIWAKPGDTHCYEEYRTCTLGLTAHIPVCAFNNRDMPTGYFTGGSYCDIYLDNCRRGKRVWRIIDYGECRFWHDGDLDNVYHTRRIKEPLLMNMLRALQSRNGADFNKFGEIPLPNQINPKIGNIFTQNREYMSQPYKKPKLAGIFNKYTQSDIELTEYNAKTERPSMIHEIQDRSYPLESSNNIFRRQLDNSNKALIVDLLGVLAKQPGNPGISFTNPSRIYPWRQMEPSKI